MGNRIRRRRKQLDMSQRELARRCKLDSVTMWRYEMGRMSPSTKSLQRIAKVLGVTTDWLLSGRAPMQGRTQIALAS